MDKREKRILKHFLKKKPARPVVSLLDDSRVYYWNDGESFAEYGFLPSRMSEWTDEEIEEYISDLWEYIRSPYDCTGKRFTTGIDWHRNPNGRISCVHHFSIDI